MKAISNSRECPNCGSNHKTKPLCEYVDGWYCFSCGMSKRYDRHYSVVAKRKIEIPEWPDAKSNPAEFGINNLKYLARYDVTPDLIRQYNVHEDDDGGLIFPSIVDDELVSYQRRILDPRRITTYGEKVPCVSSMEGSEGIIVLVEDYISHMRVGELYNSMCLFGTKLTREQIAAIVNTYTKIIVWLDNDHEKEVNAGQLAAEKLVAMINKEIYYNNRKYSFSVQHRVVHNITTDDDPKCYTRSEIQNIIQETLR